MSLAGDPAQWDPELVLAAAALGGAAALTPRAVTLAGALAICALGLLGADAALGAAEYARIGGRPVATAHTALTALFKSAGFAAVLAAVILTLRVRRDRIRWTMGAVAGVGGLLASPVVPLAPVLLLAHAAAAASRLSVSARAATLVGALALVGVILSQLLLPEGAVRLAALHLGLAAWAVAIAVYLQASRTGSTTG